MKTKVKEGNETLLILIGREDIQAIEYALKDVTVLQVYDFDWEEMLSPWPQQKVFKNGKNFEGKADQFLNELLDVQLFKKQFNRKIIVGYSLAGLFALYASTKTDIFTDCASVSGSLWYPGFVQYMKDNQSFCENIYLSLGNSEKITKNEWMSKVEDCTKEIANYLSNTHRVLLEMNEGNHFHEVDQRIVKALQYLI